MLLCFPTPFLMSCIILSSFAHTFSIIRSYPPCSPFRLVKNKVYAYPDMWVCLYDTYGCDTQDLEDECLDSAKTTEGGNASAVFYPGEEIYQQEVPVVVKLTEKVTERVVRYFSLA